MQKGCYRATPRRFRNRHARILAVVPLIGTGRKATLFGFLCASAPGPGAKPDPNGISASLFNER